MDVLQPNPGGDLHQTQEGGSRRVLASSIKRESPFSTRQTADESPFALWIVIAMAKKGDCSDKLRQSSTEEGEEVCEKRRKWERISLSVLSLTAAVVLGAVEVSDD